MGLTDYLKRKEGVTAKDVPVVIGLWEASKISVFFVSLAGVVRYQPLKQLFKWPAAKRWRAGFKRRNPKFYSWAQQKIDKSAKALAENKYFKPIPRFFGVKSKKVAMALPETLFLYKALWPLYAPALLVLIVAEYAPRQEELGSKVVEERTLKERVDTRALRFVEGLVDDIHEVSDVLGTPNDDEEMPLLQKLAALTNF